MKGTIMIRLLAAAAVACFVTPAFAQCVSTDALLARLKADGDTIAADVPNIGGAHVDRFIIDLDANGSWLWASKDGCIIGRPIGLDDAATPAPAAPKLQGSGLEIGA